jgi:hypothetical protein
VECHRGRLPPQPPFLPRPARLRDGSCRGQVRHQRYWSPVFRSEASYTNDFKPGPPGQLKGAPQAVVDIIKEAEPYAGAGNPLWRLHKPQKVRAERRASTRLARWSFRFPGEGNSHYASRRTHGAGEADHRAHEDGRPPRNTVQALEMEGIHVLELHPPNVGLDVVVY